MSHRRHVDGECALNRALSGLPCFQEETMSNNPNWQSGVAAVNSFSSAFENAAPSLYAWARLHIRGPVQRLIDPEDLLQEVCCRAFVRYSDFDSKKGNFRGWLFGFAHNVLKEALRSLRTRGESVFADRHDSRPKGLDQIADDATAISQRVTKQEDLNGFLQHTESLDEEDRRLLLYRGLEGRSHAELGELFDATPQAMEKRWQRLKKRLVRWNAPSGILLD